MASTSSTRIHIHAPLSEDWLPSGPNVILTAPLPRPPCPFSHRKISHSPEQTPPKSGGSPQSQAFFHPSFSNHAKLSWILETFKIGVSRLASMAAILCPRRIAVQGSEYQKSEIRGQRSEIGFQG